MGPRASRSKSATTSTSAWASSVSTCFFRSFETRARDANAHHRALAACPPRFPGSIWASLLVNIALFSVKLACFLRAKSPAVAASLLDSTLDLLAQCPLAAHAPRRAPRPAIHPVGARRLEAAAVIVVAAVFAVGAAEVATECVSRLARGASAPTPTLTKTDLFLLFGVVAAKLALFARARRVHTKRTRGRPARLALHQGTRRGPRRGRADQRRGSARRVRSSAAANAVAAPEEEKRSAGRRRRGSPTLWEASSSPSRCSWGGACRPGTTSPSWSASEPRGDTSEDSGEGGGEATRVSSGAELRSSDDERGDDARESRTFSFVPLLCPKGIVLSDRLGASFSTWTDSRVPRWRARRWSRRRW